MHNCIWWKHDAWRLRTLSIYEVFLWLSRFFKHSETSPYQFHCSAKVIHVRKKAKMVLIFRCGGWQRVGLHHHMPLHFIFKFALYLLFVYWLFKNALRYGQILCSEFRMMRIQMVYGEIIWMVHRHHSSSCETLYLIQRWMQAMESSKQDFENTLFLGSFGII